uniref:Putative secreted protein n=1 Tax=Corethrella appendiculata TaxID=1370023 RepID=U5EGJ3_9DIPT
MKLLNAISVFVIFTVLNTVINGQNIVYVEKTSHVFNTDFVERCFGALVSPRWVLLRHCISDQTTQIKMYFNVQSNQKLNLNGRGVFTRTTLIGEIKRHENWGLIPLSEAVNFQPITISRAVPSIPSDGFIMSLDYENGKAARIKRLNVRASTCNRGKTDTFCAVDIGQRLRCLMHDTVGPVIFVNKLVGWSSSQNNEVCQEGANQYQFTPLSKVHEWIKSVI